MSDFTFDATSVEPMENEFAPLPAGEYSITIANVKELTTNAGDGKRLSIELMIAAGEYKNRRVFDSINTVNKNPTAVEIGRQRLASICRAIGKTKIARLADFHGGSCSVRLKVRQSEQYGPSNDVVAYLTADEATKEIVAADTPW